jgi:hypothetical protein
MLVRDLFDYEPSGLGFTPKATDGHSAERKAVFDCIFQP